MRKGQRIKPAHLLTRERLILTIEPCANQLFWDKFHSLLGDIKDRGEIYAKTLLSPGPRGPEIGNSYISAANTARTRAGCQIWL